MPFGKIRGFSAVPVKLAARVFLLALAVLLTATGAYAKVGGTSGESAQAVVRYAISVKDVEGQLAEVEARFPVTRARTVLYMPIWTPGYYVKEDYKANVVEIAAHDDAGRELAMDGSAVNRWVVDTSGAKELVVCYVLLAKGRSVSLNEITGSYAVFNGSATYIAAKGLESLPHSVALSLPDGWTSATTLPAVGSGESREFAAADYETLVDSPIMAGDLESVEFESAGTPHFFVYNRGVVDVDTKRVVADLKTITDETRKFWGAEPWPGYAFLIAFREAGGGLEHKYSTFVNVDPKRFATPAGYDAFVSLLAHEYQHAFNVKRLRPLELGPFDYEGTPTVSTLWISEGLTSYYSNLMLRRSGLVDVETYLAGLSRQITALQNSPGRLKQSLEQSSREVWSNSLSGVAASSETVSYYTKGEIAGFLLDAHIRRGTNGAKSLDDVVRSMYARYSGETGFRPEQFSTTAAEVFGKSLDGWFSDVIGSASEVDYGEALDWYGLALGREKADGGLEKWQLTVSKDASEAQQARLREWIH